MAFHNFDPANKFPSVVRHKAIRMFIAKSAAQNLIVEITDICNAYLYGNTYLAVYMKQPCDSRGRLECPERIFKLPKSPYGPSQLSEI